MKKSCFLAFPLLLLALAGMGCDAGRSVYAKAAEADEKADATVDVPALYDAVCTRAPSSPPCPVAKHRAAELRLERSFLALQQGRFHDAITLVELAAKEPSVEPAAKVWAESSEIVQAKHYEAVQAQPDKAAATLQMVAIAKAPSAVASAARSWLEKSGPQALLEGVKAACRADGQGSCFELGRQVLAMYPESPAAQEAAPLIKSERVRQRASLKRAENFLVQRLMIFDRDKKIERCTQENRLETDAKTTCTTRESPPNVDVMPTVSFLEEAWKKNLATLTDPGLVQHVEARWQHVGETGENDPDTELYPEKAK